MAGEVDRAGADAGPRESQVPAGVELLGRRPAVHPEEEGNAVATTEGGGFGSDHEAGDVRAQPTGLGDGLEAARKSCIEIGHGGRA